MRSFRVPVKLSKVQIRPLRFHSVMDEYRGSDDACPGEYRGYEKQIHRRSSFLFNTGNCQRQGFFYFISRRELHHRLP